MTPTDHRDDAPLYSDPHVHDRFHAEHGHGPHDDRFFSALGNDEVGVVVTETCNRNDAHGAHHTPNWGMIQLNRSGTER
jgi:hypothetical protein